MSPAVPLSPGLTIEKESLQYLIQNITVHYNDDVHQSFDLWFVVIAFMISLAIG